MVKCELCGKACKTAQGLRGHTTFTHRLHPGPGSQLIARVALGQQVSEFERRLVVLEQRSQLGMVFPSGADKEYLSEAEILAVLGGRPVATVAQAPCPHCVAKDAEAEAVKGALATATARASDAEAELAKWQRGESHIRASVGTFTEMESCPACKPELDRFIEGKAAASRPAVLLSVTRDEAKAIARAHKLWPPRNIEIRNFPPGAKLVPVTDGVEVVIKE